MFSKGYVTLDDIAVLNDHQLTLDRRNGLDPLSKVSYRKECSDSTFEVGKIYPGRGFAYRPSAMADSLLWRV